MMAKNDDLLINSSIFRFPSPLVPPVAASAAHGCHCVACAFCFPRCPGDAASHRLDLPRRSVVDLDANAQFEPFFPLPSGRKVGERNGIDGNGFVMVAEDGAAAEVPHCTQTCPHAGRIPDNVAKANDRADLLLPDVSKDGIQRLKIRVNVADDGDGVLHACEYCGRKEAST